MIIRPPEATHIGRYAIYDAFAAGGMATVHFGRFAGPAGFARTVAIKRMHPHLAKEPEFVAMFLDEARLAARIRHPNVVSTLDIVATAGELLMVMEYVQAESLGKLCDAVTDRKQRIPVPVACAIVADTLAGLHAAHEARDERGEPLGIVHRDVSPQNVIVGADGVARVLDFGVAKAVGRIQQTREGQVKGKVAYMAPEQVRGQAITRTTDVYAASVVLWEALTGRRLFRSDREAETVERILFGTIDAPSARAPNVPEALNAVVLRGLSREPGDRFASAREMVRAMRDCVPLASASDVADWVESVAGGALGERASRLGEIDRGQSTNTAVRVERRWPHEDTRAEVIPAEAVGAEATLMGADGSATRALARPSKARRVAFAAVLLLVLFAVLAFGSRALYGPRQGVLTALRPSPVPSLTALSTPAEGAHAAPPPTPSITSGATASGQTKPPPPRPRAPRAGCDPPYTTDSDGTRHYKLQCL